MRHLPRAGTLVIRLASMVEEEADDLIYMIKHPETGSHRLIMPDHLNLEHLYSGVKVLVEGRPWGTKINVTSLSLQPTNRVRLAEDPDTAGLKAGPPSPPMPPPPQFAQFPFQVVSEVPTLYLLVGICSSPPPLSVAVRAHA